MSSQTLPKLDFESSYVIVDKVAREAQEIAENIMVEFTDENGEVLEGTEQYKHNPGEYIRAQELLNHFPRGCLAEDSKTVTEKLYDLSNRIDSFSEILDYKRSAGNVTPTHSQHNNDFPELLKGVQACLSRQLTAEEQNAFKTFAEFWDDASMTEKT